jgi:glycerol uptake facilitator-like aquaporin
MENLARRMTAEFAGTCLLVAAVVGSGIMADNLTNDVALALLCNTIATASALVVLISVFGPLSGAHFNPAVSLVMLLLKGMPLPAFLLYGLAQVLGGIAGTLLAHGMFELPLVQFSTHVRTGGGQWLAEFVAAFGLVLTILTVRNSNPDGLPMLIGLYIAAAYWFTASTSFANPAVTIARALTDTFAGIRPADAPAFVVAQSGGALAAMIFAKWLTSEQRPSQQ